MELSVGNTALAAKEIAAQTGGDLYEIRPLNPYSENYRACGKAAFAELKANARPALADPLPVLSAYDTVCLGYPNWCGTMPMAVWTFLERGDFLASGFCRSARTRAAVWAAAKPTCAGCAPAPCWGEGSHFAAPRPGARRRKSGNGWRRRLGTRRNRGRLFRGRPQTSALCGWHRWFSRGTAGGF